MIRNIVNIDESKCNGCGLCANACHENAIEIIDGKAKLIRDDYCDGMGDCLPHCPMDAITITKREAAAYDEEAVSEHMCMSEVPKDLEVKSSENIQIESQLKQWPCQIKLAPIRAPFYANSDLLIAADCCAYAYANFHQEFMKDHITLIGCTKLDNIDYSDKLAAILKNNSIQSISVVKMEVPCCGGMESAVIQAILKAKKELPLQVITISIDGKIIE